MPLPKRRIPQRPRQVKAEKRRHSSQAIFGVLRHLGVGTRALGSPVEFEEIKNAVRAVAGRARLTENEFEALNLRLDGRSHAQVGKELGISPRRSEALEIQAEKKIRAALIKNYKPRRH